MGETLARLNAAREQHEGLAQAAEQNGAEGQADAATALNIQNGGIKGGADHSGSSSELAKPHLVLSSQAGIAATTRADIHLASDGYTAITTGKSLSFSGGTSLFASVREAIRLFVQKAGMKMVAAAGDIDVQALSNSIKLLAKLDITHSASRITIAAKEEILINGGGSYAKFTAGSIEIGTAGAFTAHAATHSLPGPKNMEAGVAIAAARFSSSTATEQTLSDLVSRKTWIEFKLVDQIGPVPHQRYVLTDSSGANHEGSVDDKGFGRVEQVAPGRCTIEFPDLGYALEVSSS